MFGVPLPLLSGGGDPASCDEDDIVKPLCSVELRSDFMVDEGVVTFSTFVNGVTGTEKKEKEITM